MKISYYNNFGICALAIMLVLNKKKSLTLSEAFLIFPFTSHKRLLSHLGRSTTKITSIEKLVIDKVEFFYNFNQRYFDSLTTTINALQYLEETKCIKITENVIVACTEIDYDTSMGKRTKKINDACENISLILNQDTNKLYSNLRVTL